MINLNYKYLVLDIKVTEVLDCFYSFEEFKTKYKEFELSENEMNGHSYHHFADNNIGKILFDFEYYKDGFSINDPGIKGFQKIVKKFELSEKFKILING